MRRTEQLRELMRQPGLVFGAGAHDALTAILIEKAGFPLCFLTGAGVSMSRGYADVGLMSLEEVVAAGRYVTEAVNIPVIADADNGYGNAINTIRTIRAFEAAGLAGVHLEDQDWPKRCGHMMGKKVIPADEMVQKLHAALDARRDKDFFIMARCDALAVNGLQDTIERGEKYLAAGADALFFEMLSDLDDVRALAGHFRGRVPLHFNHSSTGVGPLLGPGEIEALGFKTVGFHAQAIKAATKFVLKLLTEIRRTGDTKTVWEQVEGFSDFYDLGGLAQIKEWEKKYAV